MQVMGFIIGRYWSGIVLPAVIMVLIAFGVTAFRGGTNGGEMAKLSDLEMIRRDSVLWSQAGITDNFIPSADRKHTDTLRDVTNLQKQLDSLFVVSVWFQEAENCLLTNCNILQSGTDPVRIRNSKHITCSHNFIDRAYNKGGRGAGYYNISHSHHCLIYKETVGRIRHLAIQNNSSFNVVYGCDLQTDVNFHNGDKGHNLIENNDIIIPVWHSWHPFSFGVPGQHQPPGPYNVIYRNRTDYKNRGPQIDKDTLYFLADFFPDSEQGESRFIATSHAEDFPDGIHTAK